MLARTTLPMDTRLHFPIRASWTSLHDMPYTIELYNPGKELRNTSNQTHRLLKFIHCTCTYNFERENVQGNLGNEILFTHVGIVDCVAHVLFCTHQ